MPADTFVEGLEKTLRIKLLSGVVTRALWKALGELQSKVEAACKDAETSATQSRSTSKSLKLLEATVQDGPRCLHAALTTTFPSMSLN